MFQNHPDIKACLSILENGGIILYPTDTVWGIGCDATNAQAVSKIFILKKRIETKAMIVLLEDELALLNYVEDQTLQIFDYIKGIHKPTTVIYSQGKNLANNLLGMDGSVAIRICKDPFCKTLIKQFGKPIVSTSANISGYPTPMLFNDISLDILEGVDYVVKYKQEDDEIKQPSAIVKWDENGNLQIIRA
ncbi:MAG: L-threonylcarbamoyladenylate synthase [Sediminibacterium sp.]|jgi:L-threonylcarbamoyladenylate synthase